LSAISPANLMSILMFNHVEKRKLPGRDYKLLGTWFLLPPCVHLQFEDINS
jgi:hypothetical protein